jgi:teichuronic acid biosynthesis glycosyltransferase TuaG
MKYSENETGLVSVIIPVYNCERFVADAIESVLFQTYKHFEIIVINDGSTDDSLTIIQKYNNRIEIISQKNSGVSAARNAGIMKAKGEYIAFLDADDTWYPDKLEKQIEIFKKYNDVVFVSGFSDCLDENNNKREFELVCPTRYHNHPANLYYELLMSGNPIWASSVIVRRDILMDTDLFDIQRKRSQDYDMWIRLSKKGLFYIINEKVGKYRIISTSQTFADIAKEYEGQLGVIQKHSWRYGPKEYKRRMAKLYYDWSESAFCYDTFNNGFTKAIKVFKLQPVNLKLLWLIFSQAFKTPIKIVLTKRKRLYG